MFEVLSTRELDLIDASSVVGTVGRGFERDLVERELGRLAPSAGSHPVADRWARVVAAAASGS